MQQKCSLPRPHLASSSLLRQARQSLINYDVHFTDEEIEAQRCEATCLTSYSQEATELCFPHMFKLVLTFEGKVRGFWKGKPAPLSPTLLESYRRGGFRVQSQRVWLPVFAKQERADSVFSPSNSTQLARVLTSSFVSQVFSSVSSLFYQRPARLHWGQNYQSPENEGNFQHWSLRGPWGHSIFATFPVQLSQRLCPVPQSRLQHLSPGLGARPSLASLTPTLLLPGTLGPAAELGPRAWSKTVPHSVGMEIPHRVWAHRGWNSASDSPLSRLLSGADFFVHSLKIVLFFLIRIVMRI